MLDWVKLPLVPVMGWVKLPLVPVVGWVKPPLKPPLLKAPLLKPSLVPGLDGAKASPLPVEGVIVVVLVGFATGEVLPALDPIFTKNDGVAVGTSDFGIGGGASPKPLLGAGLVEVDATAQNPDNEVEPTIMILLEL